MWRRSFVATSVALGGSLDDSLAAIVPSPPPAPMPLPYAPTELALRAAPSQPAPAGDAELADLVAGLRATHRTLRAAALAKALGEIALAVRQSSLR